MRIAVIAVLAAGAVACPAAAEDLRFSAAKEAPPILQGLEAQPYWKLHAECAGAMGAVAKHAREKGHARQAENAELLRAAFLETAFHRLQTDRGLSRTQANHMAYQALSDGWIDGASRAREGPKWRVDTLRSMCTELHAWHAAQTGLLARR